jgi:hypothetical protein
VDRARLRTTTAVTAAALSLSIAPLIVESAWASSGGSTAASSSKRPNAHITRSGTGDAGNGTSSDEDTDSAGEPRPTLKRTKSNSSGQKMHTNNTQEFQKVVLEELKKHEGVGLSAKDLTSTFTSSGVLERKGWAIRVTKAALSALEKKKAVEKIANSSPTKYKVTIAGLSLTSLKLPSSTDKELKEKIVALLSKEDNSAEGLSMHSISRGLGYAGRLTHREKPVGALLQELVKEGRLTSTPEGRYIPPQNVSELN